MRGSVTSARRAGLHRQRVDRAVVEALFDRRLDQPVLVDPREALGLVDRLPVLEADVADALLLQEILDGHRVRAPRAQQLLALDVLEEVLDRLQGVFLVRPDYARGTTLDPAGGVVAGVVGVEDAAALVEDQAALLVKGHALDRDAGVADGAEDEPALELFALA